MMRTDGLLSEYAPGGDQRSQRYSFFAHKMVPIYTLLGEEELAAALRRLERSEGSADGALRSAALGVAERVGEIVRAAKKEYLCDR